MTQKLLYFDPKKHEAMFHLQRDPKFSKFMVNPNKISSSIKHQQSTNNSSSSSYKTLQSVKKQNDTKNSTATTIMKNITKIDSNPIYHECRGNNSSGSYLIDNRRHLSQEDLNYRTINFYRERNARLEIVNGCRIYRIIDSDSHKTADIFVNYIPMNVFEQELVRLFEHAGTVETLRLVMQDSHSDHSRGFCFITFVNKDDAFKAIQMFDNKEFHGKFLSVQHCITNSILYIKQIPRTLSQIELFDIFSRFAPNLVNVILPQCNFNTTQRNRGFCFLHYNTYESAKHAKELFAQHRFQPWGNSLQVLWANPLNLSKSRTLFIRNIPLNVDETTILTRFSEYGRVERVIRKRDYVFVHYVKYDDALIAIDALHGKPFFITDTQPEMRMIVTLARSDRKQIKFGQNHKHSHSKYHGNSVQYNLFDEQQQTYQNLQYPLSYANQSSSQNIYLNQNHSPVTRVTVGVIDSSSIGTDIGSSTESSNDCCHCHGHSHVQYYPFINSIPSTNYCTWPFMHMYSDWCYLPVSNSQPDIFENSYLDII